MHDRTGMATGVLTQMLGSWHCLVVYLSKLLDPIARGGSLCLHALAATALVVLEADKLMLRQELTVQVSHSVLTLIGIPLSRIRSTAWDISHHPRNNH